MFSFLGYLVFFSLNLNTNFISTVLPHSLIRSGLLDVTFISFNIKV